MATLLNYNVTPIVNSRTSHRIRFRPRQNLCSAQSASPSMYWIRQGWAIRYRMLSDGRRHITAYYVPGDICDLAWLEGYAVGQAIQAVSDIEAVEMPCEDVRGRAWADRHQHDLLNRALALNAAILAEHNLSLGRRTAAERLAHLFCEIHMRMEAAECAHDGECLMPLTQVDLADICGLTSIHVNRILQELRGAKLIELKGRQLKVLDSEKLRRLAMFDPRYLAGLAQDRLGVSAKVIASN